MDAIAEMASEAERRDVSVVIFPEGTRSRTGELGDFRVGGLAAIMEAAPNLPDHPGGHRGLMEGVPEEHVPGPVRRVGPHPFR